MLDHRAVFARRGQLGEPAVLVVAEDLGDSGIELHFRLQAVTVEIEPHGIVSVARELATRVAADPNRRTVRVDVQVLAIEIVETAATRVALAVNRDRGGRDAPASVVLMGGRSGGLVGGGELAAVEHVVWIGGQGIPMPNDLGRPVAITILGERSAREIEAVFQGSACW